MQHAEAFGAVQQRYPPSVGAVRAPGGRHDATLLIGAARDGALDGQLRSAIRGVHGDVEPVAGDQSQDFAPKVAQVDQNVVEAGCRGVVGHARGQALERRDVAFGQQPRQHAPHCAVPLRHE
ncbi:hypothetical protein [Streptomyces sp. NPDC001292]|uniref:hypothetical protein n=1 Tax=Streptomyces sp. NPDC001292 TaxID=3364558 RepID=UPI0036CF2B1C